MPRYPTLPIEPICDRISSEIATVELAIGHEFDGVVYLNPAHEEELVLLSEQHPEIVAKQGSEVTVNTHPIEYDWQVPENVIKLKSIRQIIYPYIL
jgi:hypothetical protein